jgi:hypothetical protein
MHYDSCEASAASGVDSKQSLPTNSSKNSEETEMPGCRLLSYNSVSQAGENDTATRMSARVVPAPTFGNTHPCPSGDTTDIRNSKQKLFNRSVSEKSFHSLEKQFSKLGNGHGVGGCIDETDDRELSRLRRHVSAMNCRPLVAATYIAEHPSVHHNGEVAEESYFVGRRDVADPSNILEKQIKSSRGSVRGYRNRVRAGIATFLEQQNGRAVCIH